MTGSQRHLLLEVERVVDVSRQGVPDRGDECSSTGRPLEEERNATIGVTVDRTWRFSCLGCSCEVGDERREDELLRWCYDNRVGNLHVGHGTLA